MIASLHSFDVNQVAQASDFVTQGNLLAYPTEAVWGIGCDPFNEAAVLQILAIKNRPIEKGMIVIAPTIDSIQAFFSCLSVKQKQVILTSWQPSLQDYQRLQNQATTWLFPIPNDLAIPIPKWVTGGRDSLAIRVIAQPSISRLCQQLISPNNPYGFLISTSCNPSGKPPAKDFTQAYAYFADSVGYLVDETLHFTQPSQIKDAITGELVRE